MRAKELETAADGAKLAASWECSVNTLPGGAKSEGAQGAGSVKIGIREALRGLLEVHLMQIEFEAAFAARLGRCSYRMVLYATGSNSRAWQWLHLTDIESPTYAWTCIRLFVC